MAHGGTSLKRVRCAGARVQAPVGLALSLAPSLAHVAASPQLAAEATHPP